MRKIGESIFEKAGFEACFCEACESERERKAKPLSGAVVLALVVAGSAIVALSLYSGLSACAELSAQGYLTC